MKAAWFSLVTFSFVAVISVGLISFFLINDDVPADDGIVVTFGNDSSAIFADDLLSPPIIKSPSVAKITNSTVIPAQLNKTPAKQTTASSGLKTEFQNNSTVPMEALQKKSITKKTDLADTKSYQERAEDDFKALSNRIGAIETRRDAREQNGSIVAGSEDQQAKVARLKPNNKVKTKRKLRPIKSTKTMTEMQRRERVKSFLKVEPSAYDEGDEDEE